MKINVKYAGEHVVLDTDYMLVWSGDGEYFGVVEQCPYCGAYIGTGVAYRADEPIYAIARDYARRELALHIERCHADEVDGLE